MKPSYLIILLVMNFFPGPEFSAPTSSSGRTISNGRHRYPPLTPDIINVLHHRKVWASLAHYPNDLGIYASFGQCNRIEPAFFAKHSQHRLAVVSEYGDVMAVHMNDTLYLYSDNDGFPLAMHRIIPYQPSGWLPQPGERHNCQVCSQPCTCIRNRFHGCYHCPPSARGGPAVDVGSAYPTAMHSDTLAQGYQPHGCPVCGQPCSCHLGGLRGCHHCTRPAHGEPQSKDRP